MGGFFLGRPRPLLAGAGSNGDEQVVSSESSTKVMGGTRASLWCSTWVELFLGDDFELDAGATFNEMCFLLWS